MYAWQVFELFRIGPAAAKGNPGGKDLRDHIYSWPLVSRCTVEEQLVSRSYEAPNFASSLVNRRGLGALEPLLFHDGEDTACPDSSAIVANGTWAALTADERNARRRSYAVVAVADVKRRAGELVEAWGEGKGNFVTTFATAGSGNAVFPSTQSALNATSDALFYLEREVKDMKLARPLGLRECEATHCPELLESRLSGLSKDNIRANFEGFRSILEGCGSDFSGMGFDDLLESVEANGLSERMRQRMTEAQAVLETLDPNLETALKTEPASVRAFYDATKKVTDLLKTEFVTVLDLELPMSLEGDND